MRSPNALSPLAFITTCLFCVPVVGQPKEPGDIEVHIGVYNDVGAGRSLNDLMRALRAMDGAYIQQWTAEEIRSGNLADLDLLIHPGGSGSKQGKQLGEPGRERVRRFIQRGGGLIGVCAGAYLASADYSWSLNVLDAKVLDRQHWARGMGTVELQMTDTGRSLFQTPQHPVRIFYGQGPLLAPGNHPEIPDYEALAIYQSEIAKNGAPEGVMVGTTAIAQGKFGEGRVVCFSPHPEKTDGLTEMVHRAVHWVKRDGARTAVDLPDRVVTEVKRTPDISQKGLPNSDYCAPCAVANLLYQFDSRGWLQLPLKFERASADQDSSTGRSLAKWLGEDRYMDTLGRKGTNRYRLVKGIDRFVRDDCQVELGIEYLGIRNYDREQIDDVTRSRMRATVGVPRLHHLLAKLAAGEGVIILFGSYKPDPEHDGRLQRVGGHYVSVVGYGENEAGDADPACILLHDSNDSHSGNKYVWPRKAGQVIELWDDGEPLIRSRHLLRLENAPIRKDGRVAYLETIFAFSKESK